MNRIHYIILLIIAALCFAGCTTASKSRVYHDGKTVGRAFLRAGGQIAADAFNQWLEEQQ